jgi:hypothetical protein
MRISSNRLATSAATIALALTFGIPAHVALGQSVAPDQTSPGYSEAPRAINPNTIGDATLKRTAKAYVKVQRIVQKREQALNSTSDEAKQQQIAEQAEARKKAAVKAEGLQPQQYNQVIQLAQVDRAFQRKFLSYVDRAENSSN